MTNTPRLGADLQLRGRAGTVLARLHWSVPAPGVPTLLVLFPPWTAADGGRAGVAEADALCRLLCALPGLVVLIAPCRSHLEAVSTADWAAEHADELGAEPRTMAVAGLGQGADLAAGVAQHAARHGWPVVDRLVLIGSTTSGQPGSSGGAVVRRASNDNLADRAAAIRRALGHHPDVTPATSSATPTVPRPSAPTKGTDHE